MTVLPVLLWPVATLAADDSPLVCDTLLAVRQAAAAIPRHEASPDPECRRVARDRLGAVQRRAMVGGAPYECLTVTGAGRCLWLMP